MIDVAVTCTQTVMEGVPSAAGPDGWAIAGDLATWAGAIFSSCIALLLWQWNRKMVHDLAMQSVSNQWQQFNMAAITDGKLNKLLAKEEGLSDAETRELYYVFFHLTSAHQMYLSGKSDSLNPKFGEILVPDLLRPLKGYPKLVTIALDKRGYDPLFAEHVRKILEMPADGSWSDPNELGTALADVGRAWRDLASRLAAVPGAVARSRARAKSAAAVEADRRDQT